MIKELITDIAYEKITLSQALTRAKIIAFKINNASFQSWLKNELQGYDTDDPNLPPYRIINCIPYVTVDFGYGRKETVPIDIHSGDNLHDLLNSLKEHEPIGTIETQIKDLTGAVAQSMLIPRQLSILQKMFGHQLHGGQIIEGRQEFAKAHIINIVSQTKDILLETLMELDQQFPNLENEFTPSKENLEKVQNIITNNIYGDNNPTNIAAGLNVTQKDITNSFTIDYEELRKLGVEEKDLNELKTIVSENPKASLGNKLLKWVGTVTASLASKGIIDNMPSIMSQIENFINS